jgi:hypothetical protein
MGAVRKISLLSSLKTKERIMPGIMSEGSIILISTALCLPADCLLTGLAGLLAAQILFASASLEPVVPRETAGLFTSSAFTERKLKFFGRLAGLRNGTAARACPHNRKLLNSRRVGLWQHTPAV